MTDHPSDRAGRDVVQAVVPLSNIVHGVALALMLGWILHLGAGVLVPMVLALMLAYVVAGLSRLTGAMPLVGRYFPKGLRYGLAVLIIGYCLMQLVALFAANLAGFAARAPMFQTQLLGMIQANAAALGFEGDLTWETVRRDVLGEINLQAMVRTGVSSTAALLAGLIFVLLNTLFMLLEERSFNIKLGRLSSDPVRVARLRMVVADINARIGRYLAIKTLINIGLGLVSYAIMLVVGLEFAALWAIVIAILNYIPYLGSFVGVSFPVAIAIVQFGDAETVLLLLAALVAAQFLFGNVLEPQVMGNSLDLSPYAILISLTAWSSLWGIAGAVVSIPLTAVIVIVMSEFSGTRPIAVLMSQSGDLSARDAAGTD
jgi:AI-2 transport protein TqsA